MMFSVKEAQEYAESCEKPYKGRMENYRKSEYPDGYLYVGRFIEHPQFGFTSSNANTSQVLQEILLQDGSILIETRNSVYLLVSDRSPDTPLDF